MKDYIAVVKHYSMMTGKRTNFAVLCNGAYIFFGTKKACQGVSK